MKSDVNIIVQIHQNNDGLDMVCSCFLFSFLVVHVFFFPLLIPLHVLLIAAIDECSRDDLSQCSSRQICVDREDGFDCVCKPGFREYGKDCVDIRECDKDDLNDCSPDANCIEEQGSHSCECSEGYTGDGIFCKGQSPLPSWLCCYICIEMMANPPCYFVEYPLNHC